MSKLLGIKSKFYLHISLLFQHEKSLKELMNFLSSTQLQHLDLTNCRVLVTVHEGPLAKVSRRHPGYTLLDSVPPLINNTLAFLKLDNFEVSII